MMTFPEFKAAYSLRLNPQQEAAVCRTEGPALLLAVPGSGKTTVLVARLGYLIFGKNVSPDRLLTVTYTVAATKDMRRRFAELFGRDLADRLAFRTINAICASIIAEYARRYERQPFQLLSSEAQSGALLRELFQRQTHCAPTDAQIKDLRTRLSYCKNKMLSASEIAQIAVEGVDFPAFYQSYCSALTHRRLMDFDDQLVIAYGILQKFPDLAAFFCERWRYISVDEAQDTSFIQHKILAKLAETHENLFMVGDEDQSIYGFRAAYPEALMRFEKDHPGGHVLLMETNYRSVPPIVQRADALIRRNQNRRPKTMRAARAGGQPLFHRFLEDQKNQAAYLAKIAQNCSCTTAVLYRNNESALPLIDLLQQQKIPYHCRQPELSFFSHPVVRDLSNILLFSRRPADQSLFMEIIYKLDFKIKKETLIRALKSHPAGQRNGVLHILLDSGLLKETWAVEKVKALQRCFEAMPRQTSFEALTAILQSMGYGDYLEKQGGDWKKAEILLSLAAQNPCQETFLDHLEELKETVRQGGLPGEPCLFHLSTIHSSKGLEYDHVFLIDMTEGILPAAAETPEERMTPEERQVFEEERRLFYVAATRAKDRLEIISCRASFGRPAKPVSRFIPQLMGTASEKKPLRPTLTKPTKISMRPEARQEAVLKESDFPADTFVFHKSFGPCKILRRYGAYADVLDPDGRKRTLELALCLQHGLLEKSGVKLPE